MRPKTSKKAGRFTESVIREMTRVCTEHGGVNLAQGFPDFAAPEAMKAAAKRAIDADVNQYAVTWGAPDLRAAIAERTTAYNRIPTDAERNVTVCCGATEAMIATLLAVLDPGDEVIVFEPFYENYGPDCILSDAVPRYVELRPPAPSEFGRPEPGGDWTFDDDELRAAFGARTRAILVNTPHNPTGKVFTRAELERIAALCIEHDALAITDEIYEYILYDDREHISIGSLPGMGERTITISGLSKTWSATGWRVGWCVAPEPITGAIRKVHDFLTVGAPAPLQAAAAEALRFGPDYFTTLASEYAERRELLTEALLEVGFGVWRARGAYYLMTDIGRLTDRDDVAFALELVGAGGVATVPGSSFYRPPAQGEESRGRGMVRFCFAKRLATLDAAATLLRQRLASS